MKNTKAERKIIMTRHVINFIYMKKNQFSIKVCFVYFLSQFIK